MASLNGQYDADAGVPGTFDTFAAGPQPMEFTETDIAPTKDGKGKLLKYRLRITQGDLEERIIFGNLMLQHQDSSTNPKMATAIKMGQEAFAAIRNVTGVLEPDDTQDLHFKEFIGYVKITPAKGDYDAKNEIDWGKTYKIHAEGVDAVSPTAAANDNKPATVAKATPAAGAPKKAAWPRKAA